MLYGERDGGQRATDIEDLGMTGQDDETLAFYATEAEAYARRSRVSNERRLDAFLGLLPVGARVLEVGCGAGFDTAHMLAKGFDVRPTDGSPEMVEQARANLGIPVDRLLFSDIDEEDVYQGIWANACLLHVPRPHLADVLRRIHRALAPGGVFVASFKAGTRDGRDRFGRYYNYVSADEIGDLCRPLGWQSLDIDPGDGTGYDGVAVEWLWLRAIKSG